MSLQEHPITEYLPIPILINWVVVRCNLNRLTAVWKDALLDNCHTRSVLPLQGGLMTKTHYDESRFERKVHIVQKPKGNAIIARMSKAQQPWDDFYAVV